MLISLKICLFTEKKKKKKTVNFACIYMFVSCCAIGFFEYVRIDANIRNDDVIQVLGDSLIYKYSKYTNYR